MSWANFNNFNSQLSPAYTESSMSSGPSSCSSPVPSPEQYISESTQGGSVWYHQVPVKQEPLYDGCSKKMTNDSGQFQHLKKNARRRIHIPHSQRPKEFVVKRNARERRRVEAVNDAFQVLQETVPTMSSRGSPERLSKSSILRGAIDYIHQLHMALGIQNGTSEQDFYDNNQPVFYDSTTGVSPGYQQTPYNMPTTSVPEIPSPVTETIPMIPNSQPTWSHPEKEQPSVVELLDNYWNNMNIDEFTANITFSDFDIDL